MNKGMKEYIERCKTSSLESRIMKNYVNEMTENTIPKIIEDVKVNKQLAAKLRFSPTATTSRSRKKQTD